MPPWSEISALRQWFAPTDIPADVTEVDCCVNQWPPGVSILAKIESSPAHDFFLEDRVQKVNNPSLELFVLSTFIKTCFWVFLSCLEWSVVETKFNW